MENGLMHSKREVANRSSQNENEIVIMYLQPSQDGKFEETLRLYGIDEIIHLSKYDDFVNAARDNNPSVVMFKPSAYKTERSITEMKEDIREALNNLETPIITYGLYPPLSEKAEDLLKVLWHNCPGYQRAVVGGLHEAFSHDPTIRDELVSKVMNNMFEI